LRPPCWVHHGGIISPLQRSYNCPYAILCHSPAPSPSELGPGIDCLRQPAQALYGRGCQTRQSACHGSPPTPRRVCFQTTRSLHHHARSSRGERPGIVFSHPCGGFLHARASCSLAASTTTIPAATAETTSEDRPLTLTPQRSVPGGKGCGEPGYTPGPNRFQRDGVLYYVVYTLLPVQSTTCLNI
jgi:hypothetical protein